MGMGGIRIVTTFSPPWRCLRTYGAQGPCLLSLPGFAEALSYDRTPFLGVARSPKSEDLLAARIDSTRHLLAIIRLTEMTVIITVHGTFATGPRHGNGWWQIGGALDNDVAELLKSSDGELRFEPFVWDGRNSEASRRIAGRQLLTEIRKLEHAKCPYYLVGHSHGGSVINAALLLSVSEQKPLIYLRKWITVGSPFITTVNSQLLFSRLNVFGKSFYSSIIFFSIFASTLVVRKIFFLETNALEAPLINLVDTLLAIAAVLVPFGMIYFWHRFSLASIRRDEYVRNHLCNLHYTNRWIGLRHRDDEAITALRYVPRSRDPIFDKRLFVAPLTACSILVFPLSLILLALYSPFVQFIATFIASASGEPSSISDESTLVERLLFLLWWPNDFLINRVDVGESAFVILPALLILLEASAFIFTMRFLAKVVSPKLSSALDRLTLQQIRQHALGGDVLGEILTDAADSPFWSARLVHTVPTDIARKIVRLSNSHASRSALKMRRKLSMLTSIGGSHINNGAITKYLTLKELIHNTYFSIFEFRRIIIACLCDDGVLIPCSRFASSDEYAKYKKIVQNMNAHVEVTRNISEMERFELRKLMWSRRLWIATASIVAGFVAHDTLSERGLSLISRFPSLNILALSVIIFGILYVVWLKNDRAP
jgi:hypothetical protein